MYFTGMYFTMLHQTPLSTRAWIMQCSSYAQCRCTEIVAKPHRGKFVDMSNGKNFEQNLENDFAHIYLSYLVIRVVQDQKYLVRGSKWSAVVKRSHELAKIQPDNMEQVRQDVLFAWSKARVNIGHIPRD